MSGRERLIIEGGVVAVGDGRVLDGATIVVERGVISELREDRSRPFPMPSDWRIDADGRLVTPGLVNAWASLPIGREQAASHLAAAVLSGSTSAIAVLDPSLAEDIAGFVGRLGTRAVLALDASSAIEPALVALRRLNTRLEGRGVTLVPALALGRAAAWDEDRIAELLASLNDGPSRPPLLMTAASTDSDLQEIYEKFACRPVERLRRLGLLGSSTVLGQCHLMDSDEIDALAKAGSWFVSCPRRAWRDGYLPPIGWVRERGGNVALGTGDAGPGLLAEVSALSLLARAGAKDVSLGTDVLMGGAALMGTLLRQPMGALAPGQVADLVIHRHRPSQQLDGSAWATTLDGMPAADWVVVGGRVVLREGRFLEVDLAALAKAARRR